MDCPVEVKTLSQKKATNQTKKKIQEIIMTLLTLRTRAVSKTKCSVRSVVT